MLITPPPADSKSCRSLIEPSIGRGIFRSDIQSGAELVTAHLENVEQATIPERLLIDAHLFALVQINGNAELAGVRG